jgi:hypothetical protein
MGFFIFTILYLLQEILEIGILLKPIPEIIKRRREIILKSAKNSIGTNVTSSIIAILLFSWYISSANKYVNTTWFSIYSIILEIYVIFSMSHNLLFINNINKYIKIRCNATSVIITRIISIFTFAYGIIVLIKMFM